MINDRYFNEKQIPVEVNGKTYYSCCEICETTLKSDPNSRIARDPISGNNVDKALSVKGATASGKIYYFENRENLEKFNTQLNK